MNNNFESILNLVQNGIYVIDISKGTCIYINKYCEELFGYNIEDLAIMGGKGFIEKFHPDDKENIAKHMAKVSKLKKGEFKQIEYRFKSKNNEWFWLLSQDSGYEYDDEGNMISYVGSFINITDQRKAEIELEEVTTSYHKLVENSPLGMMFYTLNKKNDLIFQGANQSANRLLGLDNSQFIGKTIGEAFPPLLQTEIPDRYRDAAEKGIPWKTEQVNYDDEKISGAYEVKAFQTKPGSMVAVFDDITKRLQTEHAIKKSEELYRLLADTSTDMIARHDESGVFLYVSPACKTLLGYEPEELIGHSGFEFFHPDDLAHLEENRKKITEQPIYTTVTFRFRKKDNSYTWFETNTHTIFDEKSGEVLQIHAASRDVSERVKSEQLIQQQNKKLKELNANKDKFFRILSHDLRGPISTLSQLLRLLNNNFSKYTPEKISQVIGTIYSASDNLVSLVDDVLVWASSQSGKIPFDPKEISFNKLANDSIETIRSTASTKNIGIEIDDNGCADLVADINMLKTVIRNLVSNSIKFTNRGGLIHIKAIQDNANTIISVSDNGIGIPKNARENLFEISETTSTLGTENEKGTGVGLVICKEFVEKHKGSICVDSEEGKGSTFSIKIPLNL